MSNELISAAYALAAAVCWGGSDFSGGVSAKDTNAMSVVLVAQIAGLLCLLTLAFMVGESMPSSMALFWGAGAGVGAGFGLVFFYQALAMGQMGINAPITCIVTSVFTVLFGIWLEGMPAPIQISGFLVAMVAIWLMTSSEGKTVGLIQAIYAGLGFSVYLICSKQATAETVFGPLAIARATSVITLFVAITISGKFVKPTTNRLYMLAAGILDAFANALFIYAARSGRFDVASMLSGLYPAVTALCARFILDERVSRRQFVGITTALVSVFLIAAH